MKMHLHLIEQLMSASSNSNQTQLTSSSAGTVTFVFVLKNRLRFLKMEGIVAG